MSTAYMILIRTKHGTNYRLGPLTINREIEPKDIRSAIRTIFSLENEKSFPVTDVREMLVISLNDDKLEILDVKPKAVWPKEFNDKEGGDK